MALFSKKPTKQPEAPNTGASMSATSPSAPTPTSSPASSAATKGEKPQTPLSDGELKMRNELSRSAHTAFGQVVSLMMRQPGFKQKSLSDLEWMVVPAVMSGQFSIAEAQSKLNGFTSPIGVVMWARVSADVDKRLSEIDAGPPRLVQAEWTSGEIYWLIEAIGDKRVIAAIIQKLRAKEWAEKTVKVRTRGADGKISVRALSVQSTAPAKQSSS